MQPPSDSIRHHLHKLAEARANRNSSSTPAVSATTAPPPYTLSVTRPSGTRVMSVDQFDHEDPYASPINITIDSAINVVGDGNTITLPSSWLGSAVNQSDPETPNPNPRLSSLAAVIIAALNRANSLHDDFGNPRPLNIDLKAGVRVHGCNNTIRALDVTRKRESAHAAVGSDPGPKNESANPEAEEGSEHKRRASSEPAGNVPAAQRRRLS